MGMTTFVGPLMWVAVIGGYALAVGALAGIGRDGSTPASSSRSTAAPRTSCPPMRIVSSRDGAFGRPRGSSGSSASRWNETQPRGRGERLDHVHAS